MSLYRTFTIQTKQPLVNSRGRVGLMGWNDAGSLIGILANQSNTAQITLGGVQRVVTHTVAQKGAPKAIPGQRLLFGTRKLLILDSTNPGELDKWTLYRCEERYDDD